MANKQPIALVPFIQDITKQFLLDSKSEEKKLEHKSYRCIIHEVSEKVFSVSDT
jgi:hypothetical protein